MARCVHLHEGSVQCVSEALSGAEFCEDHLHHSLAHAPGEPQLSEHPLRKLLLRLVALILLLILMIPFYQVARSLYLSPSFQAGEGN